MKKKRRKKPSKTTVEEGTTSEYTDEEEEEEVKSTPVEGAERLQNEEETTPDKIPLSVHEQNGCDESKCDDEDAHCDRNDDETTTPVPKFDLKPDAEEFIPKAYREPPIDPNIQFVNFPPNFVPIPIIGDVPPPPYPPPFLPPAIPINFVPPNANFVNFVPNFVPKTYPPIVTETNQAQTEEKIEEITNEIENKQHFVTPNEAPTVKVQKIPNKTDIDIEKIVSKLEEAAKEQRMNENKRQSYNKFNNNKSRYHQNSVYQQKKRKETEERFNKPRNNYTETSTPKKAQNYSAMVKVAQKCPPPPPPKPATPPQNPSTPKKVTTQWISVASRKKRKNKGSNENDEIDEVLPEETETKLVESDGFESYDVNQLVDVVPPAENIPEEPEPVNVVAPEEQPKEVVVVVEEIEKSTRKIKKKSQTKRIIIKDSYEVTPEIVLTPKEDVPIVEEPQIQNIPEPLTAITESPISTPEKRTKRKKKKPQKPSIAKSLSVSSSNTTLNNFDDSYDFLLEPSVLDEGEDKTNVEISQELDRLIQKGMYNNLEEKIKSLNVTFPTDNFFSSINLTSPLAFEKNNFLKSNEFSSLFKTTTTIKPKRYDNEIDFTKIQLPVNEPQPSTSKEGIFLENPKVNEILKSSGNEMAQLDVPVISKKCKSTGKLKNKSKKLVEAAEEEEKKTLIDSVEDKTKLYPITQAVKEWMTKTRENTPEVEILKSPKTIKKELGESDEDVVLLSRDDWKEGSVEPDLLDCWENEVKEEECPETIEELVNGTKNLANGNADDVIEIYESKYGKNEDFLKIQAEVEEKKRNFPRHGNLPYRAICCSVM